MPQDMINKIMTRNMESLENSGRIQGEFTLNSWRIHAEFSTLRLAANEITARRNPAPDDGCGSEWCEGGWIRGYLFSPKCW